MDVDLMFILMCLMPVIAFAIAGLIINITRKYRYRKFINK